MRMPLMPYTHPHFDRALLNFRLFLKLGASSRGPTGNLPPPPRQLNPLGSPEYNYSINSLCQDILRGEGQTGYTSHQHKRGVGLQIGLL